MKQLLQKLIALLTKLGILSVGVKKSTYKKATDEAYEVSTDVEE